MSIVWVLRVSTLATELDLTRSKPAARCFMLRCIKNRHWLLLLDLVWMQEILSIRNQSIHRFYILRVCMYGSYVIYGRLSVCDLVRWSKWVFEYPVLQSNFNGDFLFQHLTFTVWLLCIHILKFFSLWRRWKYH